MDVFLGLYALQLCNYIMPVIIIPIIISHIGLANYGELMYITSIYQVSSLFIDFGFTYTAPVMASRYRDNEYKLQQYYSEIIFIKFVLFTVVISGVLSLTFLGILNLTPIYILSIFLCALGNVLTPLWLFQGIGDFKLLSISQIIIRVTLFIVLVLYLLVGGRDIFIISLLQNGTLILCYVYLKRKIYKINKDDVDFNECFLEFKKAGNVFIGVLGTIGYGGLIPILIGNYCGNSSLAIYSIIQKLTTACQSLITPVSQFMLSEVSRNSIKKDFLLRIRKSFYIHLIISSLACLCYLVLGQFVAKIIGKVDVPFTIIATASIITIFSSLNNVLGVQLLIPTDNVKSLRSANLISGILAASVSWYLITYYNVLGGVILNLMGEFLVFLFLLNIAKRVWMGYVSD
ncbi:oligosaccharide flippase family protein [Salmonella enterica]|nr:flippase [Salmonella enterica]EAW2116239.1 flippase [Salmonella enterica subsp. enterica]EBH9979034.1 flippase [Salmonella enterica subsp. arizonae serovar 40:z36:-]ECF6269302.1 oligosaccharide flippase family protein [Salmonella enterica subsp. arizonae]EDW2496941.1 oligosaccharide flippase family protein [Salmonella enterica subsp. enterica serovar Oranienburg]EDW8125945.1 oligosaccharide flippase family protein [Salmonella enterica subsp. salamae]EEF7981307.1 oligosaccharide flippase fa